MKTKILALVEIAIVLCSMLLVALPSIAAEQNQTMQEVSASTSTISTTASEDDDTFTLDIYGNANEDDTIDMRDTTYIKLAIFGKKPETDLADANNDGKVSMLDVGQTKLIILGKEKELTVLDHREKAVTVYKPIQRAVALGTNQILDFVTVLNAEGKVVCVGTYRATAADPIYFPELTTLPAVDSYNPDFEEILVLNPDLVIAEAYEIPGDWEYKLPGIPIVFMSRHRLIIIEMLQELKKVGYIFDKREEADEFIDFYEDCLNPIQEKVEKLSEEDKPRVYNTPYSMYRVRNKDSREGKLIDLAGGRNIAADLSGQNVEPEWVIEQNPDIIIVKMGKSGYDIDNPADMKAKREEILNLPELANVPAVKNGRVYMTSGMDISFTSFIAAVYMAKWFHPELFEDLDPKAIHQEFLTRFHRIDYDLDEHGVFVYHPEENPDGR